ncbi:MAG TPA: gephyrin-like molybdotransferase Glp [Candidatus Limnocylindrales bacterium]|nr:gephyrin-like molybdotransferase Glp [Candidatus Limnocylindrales bacterium]
MISVEEARAIILNQIKVLGTEKVNLFSALGRVLAEDVLAPFNIPPWNNTAMDGFAVIAQDTRGASREHPIVLEVIEDLPAGYVARYPVGPGQAIRIMTGAPIPDGADAVVRVEDTELIDDRHIKVFVEVERDQDIRMAGEDVKQGTIILERGTLLRPADVGLLASIQRSFVAVYQRPVVAILSTGDELVDIDEPLMKGKIVNSNGYSLAAQVLECGGIPIQLGIAKDTPEDLEEKFSHGLKADVLISSAGVSVGDYDYVKQVLKKLGADMQFWKVAMKPGSPLTFGIIKEKPVFGLPGNPVSAMVTFELFVRPALLKMSGHKKIFRPLLRAIAEENIKPVKGKTHFVRVRLSTRNGRYYASTTGPQGSGILRSMALSHGLAVISEGQNPIKVGEEVPVIVMDRSFEDRESMSLRIEETLMEDKHFHSHDPGHEESCC